jgi:hypothetical protein
MLASTVQFSRYGRSRRLDRRVRPPHRSTRAAVRRTTGRRSVRSLRTQQRAYDLTTLTHPFPPPKRLYLHGDDRAAELVSVPPMSTTPACTSGSGSGRPCGRQVLLRKEVIQPHLPVRLPCYDFVPIADPTFDGSLPRVGPPASGVTDFRDVTGGVYKARERIHRSVADLRLLATPTSRGRVADPDPN